ncbi:hypothetical protein CEUSTIGMA_g10323.t1 [Chlamydomonas eustigma]|uniref:Phosphoglycerate mutase-like protein n=1 Tax=Chlamydomonas eustigma TaxID=1157962 RepID=A0A250XIH6_9CHLO|nr:hypothetical protein CEUSTIGMA_g10323.t1 [Chlamydomonas eustigma]|eukprot:GAX82897.1 hypothetical protein CEUSTIGMA_g10323.t1 [Chlamydomonas eustigma]
MLVQRLTVWNTSLYTEVRLMSQVKSKNTIAELGVLSNRNANKTATSPKIFQIQATCTLHATSASEVDIQPSRPLMIPYRQTKLVHFIRHGQAFHNIAENHRSEEWFDAHLTPEGWRQAEQLRSRMVAETIQTPELVIVSPLTRALETVVGVFGDVDEMPEAKENALMVQQVGDEKHSVSHAAVSARGCPPVVVLESCREKMGGLNFCDRRRNTSEIKSHFPAMDWSFMETEGDDMWRVDHRETEEEMASRGQLLLQWIMRRRETSIAVVTHSAFLSALMRSCGQGLGPSLQEELHRWFENCEMRSVVLADMENLMPEDKYHFVP